MKKPIVECLDYFPPQELLAGLSQRDDLVFLDSSNQSEPRGEINRYSYIAFDPVEFFEQPAHSASEDHPFAGIQEKLTGCRQEPIPGLPPFQGGAVGCFSYELAHRFEKIAHLPQSDGIDFPAMMVGLYDCVISFDHEQKKAWIVSTGYPEGEPDAAMSRATMRLEQVKQQIKKAREHEAPSNAPRCELKSNFTQQEYESVVERVRQYILDGDVFQVNLSQCFSGKLKSTNEWVGLYLHLRRLNPSPFAAFFKHNDYYVASASPERFLSINAGMVETRPIKGTIRRSANKQEDLQLQKELLASTKDRAENTMIVDLMRNDLSRTCLPESVRVDGLCLLETYASLHHLVSVVRGELRPDCDALDCLAACFPGGSITGAPKIRAMEIITEIEKKPRGPYCGCIATIGFSGDMDSSILIRTFSGYKADLQLQVGGGIVLDSKPTKEYEETLIKASHCRAVLEGTQ